MVDSGVANENRCVIENEGEVGIMYEINKALRSI